MSTANLLDQCREHFAEALVAALAECGLRLPALQEVVRRETRSAFKELAGLHSKEDYQRLRSVTASRISLVHPEDMDLTVALINLSHALTDACERELPRLHLLFMRLLGQNSSVLDQLPVGPDAVCIALRGICDSGEIAPELRLELPEIAGEALALHLRQLYPELTRLLEEQGIEPASLLRSGQGEERSPASQRPAESGQSHSGGYKAAGMNPALHEARAPEGPLGQLHSRFLRQQNPGGQGGAINATLDPALLAAIMERVFIWLTDRQQEAASSSQAKATNLGELRALLPGESNAVLDAIGLSLETLATDTRLCAPMHASLSGLRLPLSKAALIETDFLSNPDGPARRFLEALLRVGFSLPPQSPAEHPVCQQIEAAVQQIQREFDRDPAIFTLLCERFEALETQLQAQRSERCQSLIPLAQQEAQREHSRSRAARAIRALCAGPVPRPLKIFLERLWVRVLAAIHQHGGGEKSSAWLRALRTANQLLESVQPCQNQPARDALLAGLPKLLAELRAGLSAIGTPETLQERAFQSFVSLHTAALNGKVAETGSTEDIMVASSARIEALPGQTQAFILRLPPEAELDQAAAPWIGQLENGSWLDLELPGHGWQRLQIAWLEGSPRILLGSSVDGSFSLICPIRWLQQAASETARPIPQHNLFEQAAEAALQRSRDYH